MSNDKENDTKIIFVTNFSERIYIPTKDRNGIEDGEKVVVLIAKINETDLLKLFGGK